eukprot:scaffold12996_cov18-Prasinocladus_malaysianus.AAC.1
MNLSGGQFDKVTINHCTESLNLISNSHANTLTTPKVDQTVRLKSAKFVAEKLPFYALPRANDVSGHRERPRSDRLSNSKGADR